MKKALSEDPLTRIEKQRALLKENHAKDLQTLYAYQDREVRQELTDQRKYISCNQDFIFESTIDVWDSKVWVSFLLHSGNQTLIMLRSWTLRNPCLDGIRPFL